MRKTEAIIYARFSDRPDAANSQSIANQIAACKQYARQKGYKVVATYTDEALSGDDAERPGLWAAVDDLRPGRVLIVSHLDRLARNVLLCETIIRQIKQKRARLEAVQHHVGEDDDPAARMTRQILAALAEYERRIIAQRTKMAMLRYQAQKRRMSDRPPFGFQRDPDDPAMLIENPEEQMALQRMIMLRRGGMGCRKIARYMEENGVPFRGRQRWYPATVHRILKRHAERSGE